MVITSPDGSGQIVYYQRDSYSVFDGQCYRFTPEPMDEEFDPKEPVEDDNEYYATGTTTIDGQEMYEFDLGDGLYYLSVSIGYPVRFVDSEGVIVDFHS